MFGRPTLAHKGLLLVCITLLFELTFVAILNKMLDDAEVQLREEMHAQAVLRRMNRLANLYQNLAIGMSRQVEVPEAPVAQNYFKLFETIPEEIRSLKELLKDRSQELDEVERLETLTNLGLRRIENYRQAYIAENRLKKFQELISLHKISDQITLSSNRIIEHYRVIEEQGPKKMSETRRLMRQFLAVGVLFSIILALNLGFFFTGGITRRLKTVSDNSVRLAAGLSLLPQLKGEDEIAQCDKVFHKMARSIENLHKKEKAVIENARDVICSIDPDGRFNSVNPAAFLHWGYQPEELIGNRFVNLLPDIDKEKMQEVFAQLIGEKHYQQFENRIVHKNGREIDVLWSAEWSEEEGAIFLVAHDITERKRVENMKKEFVAMVSHDLRTPLTSVQATLALFAEDAYGPVDDKGKDRLTRAQDNVKRLIKLINDLLDLEKLEEGKMNLDLAPISLSSVVQRSIDAIQALAERKNVTLSVGDSDCLIEVDRDRLVQVLVNLLGNAIKFSPPDATVTVEMSSATGSAEIRIIDRGPGIPLEKQSLIFERFKQLDRGKEAKNEGSGLGLAISRAIIEAHGGTIGVESKTGEGSVFFIKLPAAGVMEKTNPS